MSIRMNPGSLRDVRDISGYERKNALSVANFVNTHQAPVTFQKVMDKFRKSETWAWVTLNLAWECGLISKIKSRRRVYFIERKYGDPDHIIEVM